MKTKNQLITKISLLTTCAATIATGPVFAGPVQIHPLHDLGTIRSIDPQSEMFIIQDRREATLAVHWDHHTRFFEHGKPILSTDLKPGERVGVAYEDNNGQLVAKTVRVIPQRVAMRKIAL
jgi:hypothetical protein